MSILRHLHEKFSSSKDSKPDISVVNTLKFELRKKSRIESSSFYNDGYLSPGNVAQITKTQINEIVDSYLFKKSFDDDIKCIEPKGGLQWIEFSLKTNFKTGLNLNEDTNKANYQGSRYYYPLAQIEKPNENGGKTIFKEYLLIEICDFIYIILAILLLTSLILSKVFSSKFSELSWNNLLITLIILLILILLRTTLHQKKEMKFERISHSLQHMSSVTVMRDCKEIKIQPEHILTGEKVKIICGTTVYCV
jgi:magnesium-transporting ATPase (P-type)